MIGEAWDITGLIRGLVWSDLVAPGYTEWNDSDYVDGMRFCVRRGQVLQADVDPDCNIPIVDVQEIEHRLKGSRKTAFISYEWFVEIGDDHLSGICKTPERARQQALLAFEAGLKAVHLNHILDEREEKIDELIENLRQRMQDQAEEGKAGVDELVSIIDATPVDDDENQ